MNGRGQGTADRTTHMGQKMMIGKANDCHPEGSGSDSRDLLLAAGGSPPTWNLSTEGVLCVLCASV
jgi:hypothetical protein